MVGPRSQIHHCKKEEAAEKCNDPDPTISLCDKTACMPPKNSK